MTANTSPCLLRTERLAVLRLRLAAAVMGSLLLHGLLLLGILHREPAPGQVRHGDIPIQVILEPQPEKAPALPPDSSAALKGVEKGGDVRGEAKKSAAGEAVPRQLLADEPDLAMRGGTALPFDQGSEIFRAVAVSLPVAHAGEPMRYKRLVLSRLEQAKRFPQGARGRGARGIAVVAFRLGDAGELATVALLRSSGETDLDAESLALIARAAPFPAPPPGVQRSFAVDIAFGMGSGSGHGT